MAILATVLTGIAPVHGQEGLRPMPNSEAQYQVASPHHLLKDTFVSAVATCRGWGRWTTPFVLANSGGETAKFLNGAISIPPRSVAVHPGADRDVSVGWRSPIAGKVNIRAKVSDAHPSGGDGVAWAILHEGQTRQEVLVRGVIEPGGSQAIPAAADAEKLTGVAIEKGDALAIVIGRRGNHSCDTTIVEWVISDAERRVWDLAKDIATDILTGNPHGDSLGHAAVWHFSVPGDLHRMLSPLERSLAAPKPKAARRIATWTIATDDTKFTVGATDEGQLVVYELGSPAAGSNWISEPAVFPLPVKAVVGGASQDLRWKYHDAALDTSSGRKVTARFACNQPALELTSQWWARPGRGPVRHSMAIANRSSEPVTILEQPTIHLDLASPVGGNTLAMWTFHSDGGTPDRIGVYGHTVKPPFRRQVHTEPNGAFIPYAVFDAGGQQGVYVGIEWGYCRIAAAAVEGDPPGTVRVRGGEFEEFKINVAPGEIFEVPPGFLGAYRGNLDDAGNSLRRHLFNYSMPEIVQKDPTYPKVQWNAFGATGDKPGSWNSVESKYYPLVDDIAPLGFEEVMLDVGWWKGATHAPEPQADPVDWPSDMARAAAHAHQKGMRFGLYWNKGEDMASPEGRARRIAHIRRLYEEYKADMWRSDSTGGPVVGASYPSVKGFHAMLDQLTRQIPNFQWENCSGGGRIKDFGAMRRSVKIFITDTYAEHHVRQAFYDSSFAFPPAQLEGCVGSTDGRFRPQGPAGMRFAFRSASLGAPEWFLDAPNGGNGTVPWTDDEKAAVKAAVETYKTRIRPLVRNADLYHILPRPDGKHWDGIQYYDPMTRKGVVYLFKPAEGTDTMTIKLRGVESATRYRVSFEDGSNPSVEKTGAELVQGIPVTLKGKCVSELVFFEAVSGTQ